MKKVEFTRASLYLQYHIFTPWQLSAILQKSDSKAQIDFLFLIASLPRPYWEENGGMDSGFFRCTDISLFVRDQISSEQLAAAFISKALIITSNWCCIGVHWDSKENCKDIWKSTAKDRKRRGKKADVFKQLKDKHVILFKIYCWAICFIRHNAANLICEQLYCWFVSSKSLTFCL